MEGGVRRAEGAPVTASEFRRWYEYRSLTQEEVAGLLGIYRNRVSRMATGAVPVSRQSARMLWMVEILEGLRLDSREDVRSGKAARRLSGTLDTLEGAPKTDRNESVPVPGVYRESMLRHGEGHP
jgi:transcriptional regulator with XRE-family HTH domain